MKKLIVLLNLLLCTGISCHAQANPPDVFSSAGGEGTDGNSHLSWTIGEPITETVSDGTNSLTQGFHQPWVEITTDVEDAIGSGSGISVFPNPTRHVLHVVYADETPAEDRLELMDAQGRLVHQGRIRSTSTDLDVTKYAPGNYFLRLLGEEGVTKRTFKINISQ